MTSVQIGKAINQLLTNNQNLTKLVQNKVYPLVADQGTTFPFIVYRRSGVEPSSNKDLYSENVFAEIYVVAESYAQSVNVAEEVRASVEGVNGKFGGFDIEDIVISNASESFEQDSFLQILNLKIILQ